ncbi:FAD-dependent oxidoreductase domain-containing protein 1-like [Centruroides sculpturatus]|uniref:FAD-dependent oxidoreductase domain-containing protein 1-like n=1 Tax=Centruroides sculpturatus TaxID=218467 RepID=UPI000C6E87AF|nr:FAD-dependent oxidoreductase domain-containing protein 1-like [Centruroides sculpturatus]
MSFKMSKLFSVVRNVRITCTQKYFIPWHQKLRYSSKNKDSPFYFEGQNVFNYKKVPIPKASDIVIIGGGIYGSSIAYWLKERAPDSFSVMVIEKDPTVRIIMYLRNPNGGASDCSCSRRTPRSPSTDDGEIREVEFSILVIAAGPSSGEIAKMLGIGTGKGILQFPLPVQPRKRYVYFYHCPDGPTLDFPMLIDSSGAYATREGLGGYYLAGKSPSKSEEPDNSNLDVDHQYFDRCVWPLIANRVPAFEALKVKSAWAGYYDYNYFDENGIVGCHPYYGNVIFATGFSGHGIQMAPAVGKAVMELILDREYTSINLRNFGFERIIEGIPLIENHCV